MAAILLVLLYSVPIIWIPIRLGVRNGRQIDVLRETWKKPVVHASAITGMYTVCFIAISHLYSAMFGSKGATSAPTSLTYTLLNGLIVGLYSAFFIAIPVGILAVVAQRITIRWMGDRVKSGHCYGCGYDLTGNVSGKCPECGRAVSEATTNAATSDDLSLKG